MTTDARYPIQAVSVSLGWVNLPPETLADGLYRATGRQKAGISAWTWIAEAKARADAYMDRCLSQNLFSEEPSP